MILGGNLQTQRDYARTTQKAPPHIVKMFSSSKLNEAKEHSKFELFIIANSYLRDEYQ